MRTCCIVLAGLLASAAPALAVDAGAPPPHGKICLDTRWDYQALYLKGSGHDIVAKQTLGRDHRELKLSTTCIFLRQADFIRLHSQFNCIDMGDEVFTSTIDGRHQACRVTHVEPYVRAAADQPG